MLLSTGSPLRSPGTVTVRGADPAAPPPSSAGPQAGVHRHVAQCSCCRSLASSQTPWSENGAKCVFIGGILDADAYLALAECWVTTNLRAGATRCVIIVCTGDCHHTHNQARDAALMVDFSGIESTISVRLR